MRMQKRTAPRVTRQWEPTKGMGVVRLSKQRLSLKSMSCAPNAILSSYGSSA